MREWCSPRWCLCCGSQVLQMARLGLQLGLQTAKRFLENLLHLYRMDFLAYIVTDLKDDNGFADVSFRVSNLG